MPISFETFERVVLEDGDEHWELVCGRLRKKPTMTAEHYGAIIAVARQLLLQLDPDRFTVRIDMSQVKAPVGSFYIPDLFVVSKAMERLQRRGIRGGLESYTEPLPLVVEAWSPSTGDYDVTSKIPEYQRRGDVEIWLIHPYERWLRAWRRQPDGSYTETLFTGETVIEPVALPGVGVALAALFE
ncbi:MAG TPA: Uma2 family endonuclease [Dehalococcoidia bacterium]|nr:Uma2 family endonuclease [Dehalococcoidia bacterium]